MMASLGYPIEARDAGQPVEGLTPSWVFLKQLGTHKDIRPFPEIVEVGFGIYEFELDPELTGDCVGQVDFGDTISLPQERYHSICCYMSDSRVTVGMQRSRTPTFDDPVPVD